MLLAVISVKTGAIVSVSKSCARVGMIFIQAITGQHMSIIMLCGHMIGHASQCGRASRHVNVCDCEIFPCLCGDGVDVSLLDGEGLIGLPMWSIIVCVLRTVALLMPYPFLVVFETAYELSHRGNVSSIGLSD